MTNSKLTIGIKDSFPYIISNNDNVELVIINYDIQGIEHEDFIDTDDLGNKCIIDVLQ